MSKLNEKHRKALYYLRQNRYPAETVAKKSGLSRDYLYHLMSGAAETGELGQEFQTELHKINGDIEHRTNQRLINIREKLYKRLEVWIDGVNANDIQDSRTRHKELIDAINALNRAYPQINIESHVWKVGISREEALNELRRLTATAHESFAHPEKVSAIEGTDKGILVPC